MKKKNENKKRSENKISLVSSTLTKIPYWILDNKI